MEYIFILKVLIEEELLEMGEVMVGFVVSFFVWINGVEFVDKLNLDLCMLILFVIKWQFVVVYGMLIVVYYVVYYV